MLPARHRPGRPEWRRLPALPPRRYLSPTNWFGILLTREQAENAGAILAQNQAAHASWMPPHSFPLGFEYDAGRPTKQQTRRRRGAEPLPQRPTVRRWTSLHLASLIAPTLDGRDGDTRRPSRTALLFPGSGDRRFASGREPAWLGAGHAMKVGFPDTNVLEGWRWSRRTRINVHVAMDRHREAQNQTWRGWLQSRGKDHLRRFPYRASGLLPIAARIFAAQFGDWRTRC